MGSLTGLLYGLPRRLSRRLVLRQVDRQLLAAAVRPDASSRSPTGWPSASTSRRAARRGRARSSSRTRRAASELARQGITKVDDDVAAARAGAADAAVVARLDGRPVPGDPGRLPAALVPVRAVQDSVGLDDPDAAGRRPDPGQQVPLRRAPAGDQQEDHRQPRPAARRRDGVPLSRRTRASTTSSASSACPATRSRSATSSCTINGQPVPAAARRRRASTTRTRCATRRSSSRSSATCEHRILVDPQAHAVLRPADRATFPFARTAATVPRA